MLALFHGDGLSKPPLPSKNRPLQRAHSDYLVGAGVPDPYNAAPGVVFSTPAIIPDLQIPPKPRWSSVSKDLGSRAAGAIV